MKRRLYISLWTLGLYLLTAIQTFGQVSICGDKLSSHPVDIKALYLKDSLRLAGIDTIIVYRHWLGTNGFNGYGKVIWIDKGRCFQYKIEFDYIGPNFGIKHLDFSKLYSNSLINFFFDNQIDTVKKNPTKKRIIMSHDAEHFVMVSCKNYNYCYLISGLLVFFNSDNLRAKFVSLLSDENNSDIRTDGVSIPIGTKKGVEIIIRN